MTNQEYEAGRNKLIHMAESFADGQVPGAMGSDKSKNQWNRVFIHEMDRLAVKAGLQSVKFH
jgi:hypothetical protein